MAQPGETIVDPRGTLDRWYVTNGVVALGPVSFDRLIQDAATGQLPPGALVRHQNWKVWRRLEELEALSSANRQRAVEELSSRSRGVEQRAAGALSEPPPPPPTSELVQRTSTPDTVVRASLRPVAVDPVGVLSSAERLEDALLLTLSTAVTAAAAPVGLLHQVWPEIDAIVTTAAQGSGSELLLGERLSNGDPAVSAARSGYTLIEGPHLGDAGRHIAGRIGRCVPFVCGVAMVPLSLHGRLVAMLELGRQWRPFRAREIARVEDVIEALAERIVFMGWLE